MIEYDKRKMALIMELLKENRKFLNNAVNDTIRGIRTDISSDKIGVRKELNVKKNQVTDLLTMRLSNKKDLEAKISVPRKGIPAYDKKRGWSGGDAKPGLNFSGKRLKRPRAKSKSGRPMKGNAYKYVFKFKKKNQIFYNAFPAKMKSGHVGIWIRENGKLKEIISSSVYSVIQNESIRKPLFDAAEKRFLKNLEKQIERLK